jgi:hypothetical protein
MHDFLSITLNEMGRKKYPQYIRIRGITGGVITGERCIGQTGKTFHGRYKEHIRSIRNNKDTTGHTHHILNTGHSYGPINDTMETVTILKKGKHLNTKKYHIYCVQKCDRHMKDTHTDNQNPILNSIYN